ncbi:MAG: PEGA domain-containing protein [Gammaproteobacteria bacterium]|nr:PEGA domain-containing protein [Gammaproteobacteria bacterium]
MKQRLHRHSQRSLATLTLILACLVLALPGHAGNAADSRSISVIGLTPEAVPEAVSRPGFALLLGASRYRSPRWPDLGAIPEELRLVEQAFRHQGFVVRSELDLPATDLNSVVREFMATYGAEKSHRIVIYFAGHGYSRQDGRRGYLVPVDAPHPQDDAPGFLARAIEMSEVIAWARQMDAEHALFIFDSCFSGTVLQQRGQPVESRLNQQMQAKPVRHFITAGGPDELVPARSDFAPALAAALTHGLADLDGDGFITGTELGMYLQGHISQYGRQTPWHAKLPDPRYSAGEFIFRGAATDPRPTAPAITASVPHDAVLRVESSPSGAMVYLDGRLAGLTPVRLTGLTPKHSRLELRLDGHEPQRADLHLRPGEDRLYETRLVAVSPEYRFWLETRPSSASVRFISHPSLRYAEGMTLPPGRYRLEVTAVGHDSEQIDVEISTADVRLVARLDQHRSASATPPVSAAAPVARRPTVSAERPATCWAQNSFGQMFYWFGPSAAFSRNQALAACATHTPPWGQCAITHCQ